MLTTTTLFSIASFIFTLASTKSAVTVWRHRETLNGFDMYGASMTAVGMMFIVAGYYISSMWLPIALSCPTIAFWTLVAVYTIKQRFKR